VESTASASTRTVVRTRPRAGELIAGASGLLLLVAMLLPWYGRETDVAGVVLSESWNAWQALSIAAVLLFGIGVTAISVPAARALWAPTGGFRADRLLMPLGLLGLALVLLRLIDMPIADIDLVRGDRVDSSRGPGLFLALLATAGIAYGGRRA
jgi:hypothetical protein